MTAVSDATAALWKRIDDLRVDALMERVVTRAQRGDGRRVACKRSKSGKILRWDATKKEIEA